MVKYYLTYNGKDIRDLSPFSTVEEMIEHLEMRIRIFNENIKNYGYRKETVEISFGSFKSTITIE